MLYATNVDGALLYELYCISCIQRWLDRGITFMSCGPKGIAA